jgi:hypothetical protein
VGYDKNCMIHDTLLVFGVWNWGYGRMGFFGMALQIWEFSSEKQLRS